MPAVVDYKELPDEVTSIIMDMYRDGLHQRMTARRQFCLKFDRVLHQFHSIFHVLAAHTDVDWAESIDHEGEWLGRGGCPKELLHKKYFALMDDMADGVADTFEEAQAQFVSDFEEGESTECDFEHPHCRMTIDLTPGWVRCPVFSHRSHPSLDVCRCEECDDDEA